MESRLKGPLGKLRERMAEDVAAVFQRDPAARSTAEVVTCYPGLHALWLHRTAHALYRRRLFFAARLLSHVNRAVTGVEIHPGARIGRRVVIDHGMGVVIGETAVVGDDVLIYHGASLAGNRLTKEKRHPTIGSRVVLGIGSTVLGDIEVGDDARVGAGAVVSRPVEPGATVVGVPAHPITLKRPAPVPMPNLEHANLPDPIADAIAVLLERIDRLETEIHLLRGQHHSHDGHDHVTHEDPLEALVRDTHGG